VLSIIIEVGFLGMVSANVDLTLFIGTVPF